MLNKADILFAEMFFFFESHVFYQGKNCFLQTHAWHTVRYSCEIRGVIINGFNQRFKSKSG